MANLQPIKDLLNGLRDVDPDDVLEEEDETFDEAVADALKEVQKGAWHSIQNAGYSKGKSAVESTIKQMEKRVESQEEQIEKLREEREQLSDQNPDLDRVKKQYEKRISELEDANEQTRTELEERLRKREKDGMRTTLRSKLADRIDSDALVDAHVDRIMNNRVKQGEDKFSFVVTRADEDMPITLDSDEDPLAVVADEVVNSINDPRLLKGSGDRGGGSRSGGGGASNANKYDKAVQEGKDKAERQNEQSATKRQNKIYG